MKAEVVSTNGNDKKSGGGVYDLKITAKLRYNILRDIYENENGLTSINPITPNPKANENNKKKL